jgi:hypothetical protein
MYSSTRIYYIIAELGRKDWDPLGNIILHIIIVKLPSLIVVFFKFLFSYNCGSPFTTLTKASHTTYECIQITHTHTHTRMYDYSFHISILSHRSSMHSTFSPGTQLWLPRLPIEEGAPLVPFPSTFPKRPLPNSPCHLVAWQEV